MGETPAPIQSADLSGIIDRVRNLTGPNREVDALVHIAFFTDYGARMEFSPARYVRFEEVWLKNRADHINHANNVADWWKVPAYTASIKDSATLVGQALPGWDWGVQSFGEDGAAGQVWQHGYHDDTVIWGHHAEPPIALLLAALKAARAALSGKEGQS